MRTHFSVMAFMLVTLAVMISLTTQAGSHERSYDRSYGLVGWISFKPVRKYRNRIRLRALAFSRRPVSGRYTFSLVRKGRGGIANSNQSGVFSTNGEESRLLSQITVNIPRSSTFQASLQLFVRGKLVFSAVLDNNR